MKKIGIFGGTFSPPHNGHIAAAKAFIDELELDELIVMPANIPPHKAVSGDNPSLRLEMAHLAFGGLDKTIVSDYEINTPGKSYTANTLQHFCSDDIVLYFLCGTDMFITLANWYRPDIICSIATIVLARRECDSDEEIASANALLKSRYKAKTVILSHNPLEISSTLIRSKIAEGSDVSSYVPEKIIQYINDRKLYRKMG